MRCRLVDEALHCISALPVLPGGTKMGLKMLIELVMWITKATEMPWKLPKVVYPRPVGGPSYIYPAIYFSNPPTAWDDFGMGRRDTGSYFHKIGELALKLMKQMWIESGRRLLFFRTLDLMASAARTSTWPDPLCQRNMTGEMTLCREVCSKNALKAPHPRQTMGVVDAALAELDTS